MQEEKKKLVNQARKGDTHAFAKLYEKFIRICTGLPFVW